MPTNTDTRIVLILGDQLSLDMAALCAADKDRDVVLMAEVMEEATYVGHHKKKLAFIFSAMRHFAKELQADGWTVDYVRLEDGDNSGAIASEIGRAMTRHNAQGLLRTRCGEWRLENDLERFASANDVPVETLDDDRFLCSRKEFADWAEGRKGLRMEHFYREMRKKTGLLMDKDKPEGGQWNYDSENRKTPGKDHEFPRLRRFQPDDITQGVLKLVSKRFADNFGDLEPFQFAVTRDDAHAALNHFIEHALPTFGDYQDAMLRDERFLSHSVISMYINVGLVDPLDICKRVEKAYYDGTAPLNAAEGFIRQIIGWREYVRGVYWLNMPSYMNENYFDHDRPLPAFYWTGETDMACMAACVSQTKEEAYAHHIQRLMVTGNFALLAGVAPREIHDWYLAVYADAFEWVELPNTLGMSQFADGGLLGSKPYVSGGNYINKMSNYCKSCRYKIKEKTGSEACPFNYLYWDFMARHRDKLKDNHRLGRVYSTWDRMDENRKGTIRSDARTFLEGLT